MNLEKYIEEVLGVDITIVPLEKHLIDSLPLYITQSYKISKTILFNKEACLLSPYEDSNNFTPDQLSKQKVIVENTVGMAVIFIFNSVVSYNLKRYIQRGINFIIPAKQLFAPDLMVDIRKVAHTIKKKAEKITPLGQFVLFYHIQKKRLNGMTISQLSKMLSIPYLNVNRAINNLCDLDLCNLVGGKEKQIQFAEDGKALWYKSLPVLIDPILKIVYTDKGLDYTRSGINALSHYTMLNDERRQHYAIGKESFKNTDLTIDKQFGNNNLEIWKYDPVPLSEEGVVDRLSLYMIYKDHGDVRIQGELKTLIEEAIW